MYTSRMYKEKSINDTCCGATQHEVGKHQSQGSSPAWDGSDVPIPGLKISSFLGAMERDGGRPWAGV